MFELTIGRPGVRTKDAEAAVVLSSVVTTTGFYDWWKHGNELSLCSGLAALAVMLILIHMARSGRVPVDD